jgi:hypothetical protein
VKNNNPEAIFCLFFVLLSVFARVFLFAQNFDLAPDEARLAANIWYCSFADIFSGNLIFGQNAPLGFLLIVKILASIFGSFELVLRLVPFIAGILLFPLAYEFAVKEFNEKYACIFLFFLTCSDPLLYYSIQFKQYSIEAFIALLLIYKRENCAKWSFILLAMASILFSTTAPMVLFGIYMAMLLKNYYPIPWNLLPKMLILFSFSILYYILWLNQLDSNILQDFWKSLWFPNLNFIQFIGRHFINFMPFITQYEPYVYLNAALTIILALSGFYFLLKTKKNVSPAILSILFLISLFYFLKIYPLGMPLDSILELSENFTMAQVVGSRLILYFLPLIFIVISFSLYKFLNHLRLKVFIAVLVLFALLSLLPNIGRLQNGLGISEYSILLEKIKPYSTNNTALFVSTYNYEIQIYYQRKNLQDNFFSTHYGQKYTIHANLTQSIEFGKKYDFRNYSIEELLLGIKSLGANRVIFLFTNYDPFQIQYLQSLLDHLPKSNHEWLIIPSKDAAAVIVEI